MQRVNEVEHQVHAKHFHLHYQMKKNECLNQVNPISKFEILMEK
jgi:hypothetical protein